MFFLALFLFSLSETKMKTIAILIPMFLLSCISQQTLKKNYTGRKFDEVNSTKIKQQQQFNNDGIKEIKREGYDYFGYTKYKSYHTIKGKKQVEKLATKYGADYVIINPRKSSYTQSYLREVPVTGDSKRVSKTKVSDRRGEQLVVEKEEVIEGQTEYRRYKETYDLYYVHVYLFKKMDLSKSRFGFRWNNTSENKRVKYERNYIPEITLIYKNCRFYDNNFLEGDLILSVNGNQITNEVAFKELILADQTSFEFEILRGDKKLMKKVIL